MLLKYLLCAFLVVFTASTSASIGGYISAADKEKLKIVLARALVIDGEDTTSSYYAAKGFKLLNQPIVNVLVKDNCAHLSKFYAPSAAPEDIFLALSSWTSLGCQGQLHKDNTLTSLKGVLESPEKHSVADIRYAVEALKLLNQAIPNQQKLVQVVQSKLREDDSLVNLGHSLHLGASMGGNAAKQALDRVEEIVVQADEVDGKLLQWEGGLTTTALLITGLLRLQGAKPFTPQQAEKFGAYLLTRRTVQTPKGALALIEASLALSGSDVSPVCISIEGPAIVTVDKPELRIRISDVWGNTLKTPPTPVVAQSATRVTDDVVVLSKQPLSPGGNGMDFVLPLRLEPGQYRVALTAGSHSTTLVARITGPVKLESLEIGLTDSDGSSAPKLTKLQHPNKLTTTLQADSSQHLTAKFALSRNIQQTFLRLFNGKKEIIFVAEPENSSSKKYKLDVNLATELQYSDTFQIELILGDSVMNNPIRWVLGSLEVTLNKPKPEGKSLRAPKPEIKHLFRQPENRPPEMVSLFFTLLTWAPLLLLLLLWLRISPSMGNFSLMTILFHVGLGGILSLFALFWMKLDMFCTCAWLIPIGGFTFLTGQKMLSQIAKLKK